MGRTLRDSIAEICKMAPTIREHSENTRKALQFVEDELEKMHLGVPAEMKIGKRGVLKYARICGKFRLHVIDAPVYSDIWYIKDLDDDLCMRVIAALPALLEAMLVDAQRLAQLGEHARSISCDARQALEYHGMTHSEPLKPTRSGS